MHLPVTEFSSTKPISRWEWLVPGAIAAVLMACCVLISPKKPVWFDEVITWIVATDPSLRHMLDSIATSADLPATYYLSAQLWRHIFGSGALALRLLSAVAISGGVLASWAALRRSFSFAATAFAHVAIFCTSTVLLFQDVELRSYGVFIGVMALALLLYARVANSSRATAKLLILTAFCHGALVLCHIFGLAYSAALLLALCICDFRSGRLRPRVYAAICAGWVAFVPSIIPLIRLVHVGRTHSWSNSPGLMDLLPVYAWPDLPILIAATCLLLTLSLAGISQWPATTRMRVSCGVLALLCVAEIVLSRLDASWSAITFAVVSGVAVLAWGPPCAGRASARSLLYLSLALIALPLGFFLAARFIPPMFVPRYFLPTIFAFPILLAAFFDNALAWFGAANRFHRTAFAVGLISLLIAPLYGAVRLPPNDVPSNGVSASALEQLAPNGLTILVEDPFAFLPLYFHSRGVRTYVYLLNRHAAEASRFSSAVINFDLLRRLSSYGYLEGHVLPQQEFLAATPTFLVLHKPGFAWFDLTLANNSGYSWRTLGQVNGSVLVQVHRTSSTVVPDFPR